jgi:release factor glutamine methyltransferase
MEQPSEGPVVGAYVSSEDSALLRSVIKRYSGEASLEIGAGNGGGLVELSKAFSLVVGSDLGRPAMADWAAGADYVLADAAGCFRDATFDLVAFNPPYIDADDLGDRTVEGGRGLEVPLKFLREALRTVRPGGKVVMLLDDRAELSEFEDVCADFGFGVTRVATRRMFFEELTVYEVSKLPSLPDGSR